jgi:hypothetical protein
MDDEQKTLLRDVARATDLVDLIVGIAPTVEFEQGEQGAKLGYCPFHQESGEFPKKTLLADPSKKIFYCPSCEKGGDAINFVSYYYNFNRLEAAYFLARRANIPFNEPPCCEEESGDTESFEDSTREFSSENLGALEISVKECSDPVFFRENLFIAMLLRDGNHDTIRYYCEQRRAAEIMSIPETRAVLAYLKESYDSYSLFHVATPLFNLAVSDEAIAQITATAQKDQISLDAIHLKYVFKKSLRIAKPTLEELECAFERILFEKNLSALRDLPRNLNSSKQEALNGDVQRLLTKYTKKE